MPQLSKPSKPDQQRSGGHAQQIVRNTPDPAGILACIVQECANSLVFVSAIFQGDADHPKQMGEIRNLRALAELAGVNEHRVVKGLVEAW